MLLRDKEDEDDAALEGTRLDVLDAPSSFATKPITSRAIADFIKFASGIFCIGVNV